MFEFQKKIQYDLIESGSKVIQTPNKETCLIAREVGYDRDILVAGRISGTQHSSMKTRQMEEEGQQQKQEQLLRAGSWELSSKSTS